MQAAGVGEKRRVVQLRMRSYESDLNWDANKSRADLREIQQENGKGRAGFGGWFVCGCMGSHAIKRDGGAERGCANELRLLQQFLSCCDFLNSVQGRRSLGVASTWV